MESFNKAASIIFGYAPEEVVGQNVSMLMHEPQHSHHDDYLQHYRDTGEARVIGVPREVSAKRKNEEVFPMNLSVSKISRSGKVTCITTMLNQVFQTSREAQRNKTRFVLTNPQMSSSAT